MKKIHYLTCVAFSVASAISANAMADSLQDALKGGTFSGSLRNTLELATKSDATKDAGALNNAKVFGSAITLDYVTGNYYGFKLGMGTETGYDWGLQSNETSTVSGGENDQRVTVNTTNLYNAFLQYDFNKDTTNTMVRVGRQKIVSPLILNSGYYPMQDSFDAFVLENKDIPDTMVRVMALTRWNMRYGSDGTGLTQTTKGYHNPVSSIYIVNNSIKGLNVQAQYMANHNDENAGDPPTAVTVKDYNTSFLSMTYHVPNSKWIVGAKRLTANFKNSADTSYWGAMVKNTFNDVGVQLAYTSVDDANSFPGSLGHAPMFMAYNPGVTDEYIAGLDTVSAAVDYDFGLKGFKSTVGLTHWKQSAAGVTNSGGVDLDGGSEASLRLDYTAQEIKGLSMYLQLSYVDFNQNVAKDNMTVLRTSVNYKF